MSPFYKQTIAITGKPFVSVFKLTNIDNNRAVYTKDGVDYEAVAVGINHRTGGINWQLNGNKKGN